MARKQKTVSLTSRLSKPLPLSVIIIVALGIALTIFRTIDKPAADKTLTSSTNPSSSMLSKSKSPSSSSSSSPPADNDSSSNGAPETPHGDFISNHNPPQGSSYAETSVCITTPGATCSMTFTSTASGSNTYTLPDQITDSSGTTSWSWDASMLGKGSGYWKVTITATLNSQTSTTTDSIDVES